MAGRNVVYILVFGRELSWGRALLMQSDGTMPKWRELGIWGDIAHPLIGLLIALLLFLFWRGSFFSVFENRKNTNVGFNIFSSIYSFS